MSDNEDEKSKVIEKRHEHVLPGEHEYEGILFFGYTPPDILDAVKDFEVRDSDIFLSTYLKAGTTWLQELAWLIMNDGNFDEAIQKPVYFRSPFLEFKDEDLNEVGLDLAYPMPSPRVIKTNLPVKLMPRQIQTRDCKTIVLFRNPKDLCVSYYHFYRASSSFGDFRGTWEDFFFMFLLVYESLESPSLFDHGSWFDYTRSWWARQENPRVCILYFEDMKSDLRREIDRLCDFLEKPLQEGVRDAITGHCLFDSMRTNPMTNHLDVYSINSEVSPLLIKGEHVYEGVLFFGYTPPDTLDAVKDFEVRDSDIFLSTYPKAGTTWLHELTWLIMNDGNFDEAIQKPVYFRSPFLEFKDEVLNEVGLDLAIPMPSPRVIKTHLPVKLMPRPIKTRDCKTVVLFRNPKDLCVSYYHFYRASSSFGDFRGTWEDFFYMFLDGHSTLVYVDHGSWFDYTRSWWARREDPRICILYFEDMKSDLRREIDRLCEFLEKPLQEGVRDAITGHCLFDSMRSNPMTNHLDVYSINSEVSPLLRKDGEVGDWKNLFTVTQSELFDKFYKDEIGDLNIPFKFTLD